MATKVEALARSLIDLPERVADIGGQMVQQAALRYSHGPFSTSVLKSMYDPHGPYSKASPHPPAHPGQINYQSGLFAHSWHQTTTVTADAIKKSTFNTAPYAKDLEHGTDTAIARGLPELVVQTTFPLVMQRIAHLTPALP